MTVSGSAVTTTSTPVEAWRLAGADCRSRSEDCDGGHGEIINARFERLRRANGATQSPRNAKVNGGLTSTEHHANQLGGTVMIVFATGRRTGWKCRTSPERALDDQSPPQASSRSSARTAPPLRLAAHHRAHRRAVDQTIAERTANAKVETFLRSWSSASSPAGGAGGRRQRTDPCARQESWPSVSATRSRSQLSAITSWIVGDRLFVRSVGLNPVGGINPPCWRPGRSAASRRSPVPEGNVARTVHRSDVVVLMGVDQRTRTPRRPLRQVGSPTRRAPQRGGRTIADDVERNVRALLDEMGFDEAQSAESA